MQEPQGKPFQSGREVYRRYIPGYRGSDNDEAGSIPPEQRTGEESEEALKAFLARVEALKAEMKR